MIRTILFSIVGAAFLAGSTAFAQTTAPATPSGAAPSTQSIPSMAQMDEHMTRMQTLHAKMTSAATPEERQKAMDEARKEMQSGMAMMQPMMHGGGMMGEGMMGQKGGAPNSQMQMQMMSRRMDMMQMMMQMMMDQQGMMAPPKAPSSPQK